MGGAALQRCDNCIVLNAASAAEACQIAMYLAIGLGSHRSRPRVAYAVDRVLRLLEHALEHGLKGRQRKTLGLGIKSRPIILLAEIRRARKMRMPAEQLPHIAVHADVVKKVVALKNAVLFHHPMILFRNEWFNDRRADIGMVEGPERVSNIVQQRARHVLVVVAVLHGKRRGKQRVMQAVHRKAPKVSVQEF